MPFGEYSSMSDCISKNSGKDDPAAYCAQIHYDITGKWPSEYVKTKAKERFRVDEVNAQEFDACIDANLDKTEPTVYCANKFGIPVIHTGFEKESLRHADFQRILNEFNNYYCKGQTPCSKGETEYYVWLSAVGLDESREYGSAIESFSFAKDMISLWREDKLNKYYKVLVGFPTKSMNGNVYRERDLDASAESLVGVSPNLNHKDNWIFDTEHGFEADVEFVKAKYEDGAVEAVLKVPKTVTCPICNGDPLVELIDSKRIVNVSLEGSCVNLPPFDQGECRGFQFTGCALLTTDVLPGIPMARIFPLEAYMKEAFSRSPLKGEKLKVEIIMNKPKKEAIVSPETPNVPVDTEPEMPGGDMQCEKGFFWSADHRKCMPITCPEGEVLDQDTGLCVKVEKPTPEGTDVTTGTEPAGDTSTVPIEQVDQGQGQGRDEHGCIVGTEKWDGEKCVPIENLPKDQGMPKEQTFTFGEQERTDAERAKAHFKITDAEWDALSEEEKAKKIALLPERGSATTEQDAPPPCPSGQYRNPQTGKCEPVKVPPETGFIKPLSEQDEEPCQDGYHKDEEGNCVPDETTSERVKRIKAEMKAKDSEMQAALWEEKYIESDKRCIMQLGIITEQKRAIRKLEQQSDTFYQERVKDQSLVAIHSGRAKKLATDLKTNQRELEDAQSELKVVTEKYNYQLKTNLDLTKELRRTKESWLSLSKDKDATTEKLKKAKRLGKVIVKV